MFKNGHALCEKWLFSSSFSLWVFYACFAHLINLSSISSTVSFEIGASILLLSLTLDEKFSGFFFFIFKCNVSRALFCIEWQISLRACFFMD